MLASKISLKGRHFLTLKDYTPEEIEYLIDLAADLKQKKKKWCLNRFIIKRKKYSINFRKRIYKNKMCFRSCCP